MKKIVLEKIRLLSENPRHPSLNVHPLHNIKANIWDCYITDKMRLLYENKDGNLLLWDIGEHAIVDRVHLRSFAAHTRFKRMEEVRDALPPRSDVIVPSKEPTRPPVSPATYSISPVTGPAQPQGTYNYFRHFQDAHLRIFLQAIVPLIVVGKCGGNIRRWAI